MVKKNDIQNNIVYGSPGNFQGDLLRHEFELQGTRGSRKYDTVIVDEVDNMLIDDARHITMLSGPMPGFEYLLGLLLNCWNILNMVDSKFQESEKGTIWINEDISSEDGKLLIPKQEFRSNVWLVTNRFEFTSDIVKESLRAIVGERGKSSSSQVEIPQHLRLFAFDQCKCWAESAWKAKHNLRKNEDYIIKSNKDGVESIFPVDSTSTGSIQQNMVLSDGLHQFLQIQNGLRLTAENLVTSFVSNVGYFKRYNASLYGLTGTIGTEDSQELLKEVYNIEIGFMPTFKKKQLKEIPIVLNKNRVGWLAKICNVAITEANKRRAVLIINETIEDANQIKEMILKLKFPRKNLIAWTG